MRNRTKKRKKPVTGSVPRLEHEGIITKLEVEIADLKAKLAKARQVKLAETLSMMTKTLP